MELKMTVTHLWERLRSQRKTILFWAVCYVLTFGRYLYQGFEYYLQMDDYVQIGVPYTAGEYWQYVLSAGLLNDRPLAWLLDGLFWSRFSENWVLALGLLTLLFVLSAVFFEKVFRRWFGASSLFVLLYLLLPINFEGAYWISASTRIVTSLFFVAFSLWFLDRYIDTGRVPYLFGYFLFGLCSTGFYEQGIVLGVACSLLLMLFSLSGKFAQEKTKRGLAGLLSLGYTACYFLFTFFQSGTGANAGRMVIHVPWEPKYIQNMAKPIAESIVQVGVKGTIMTYAKGFWRG